MRKAFAVLLAVPLLFATSFAQSRIHAVSFYSPSVHDTMHAVVLLPSEYDHNRTYPVLFLLHGYGGDQTDWTERTDLVSYTAGLAMIIVMPEAKNSWYVNSDTDPHSRYEDYIVHDLPDFVNSIYPIDTTKEAIAGLSMGGYGALELALRFPAKFQFAGDLSGAIIVPGVVDSVLAHPNEEAPESQSPILPSILKAFGEKNKQFRENHDVFFLLRRDRNMNLPYFFFAVGIQDGYRSFLPATRRFTDMLRDYGKSYEYHEVPGVHNWKFWNMEIVPLLARMEKVMKLGCN
jgi:putative tributyrin esterase